MLPLLKHHVSRCRESNCSFTHHSYTLIRNRPPTDLKRLGANHLKSTREDTKHTLETNPPRSYHEPIRILIESILKAKP